MNEYRDVYAQPTNSQLHPTCRDVRTTTRDADVAANTMTNGVVVRSLIQNSARMRMRGSRIHDRCRWEPLKYFKFGTRAVAFCRWEPLKKVLAGPVPYVFGSEGMDHMWRSDDGEGIHPHTNTRSACGRLLMLCSATPTRRRGCRAGGGSEWNAVAWFRGMHGCGDHGPDEQSMTIQAI